MMPWKTKGSKEGTLYLVFPEMDPKIRICIEGVYLEGNPSNWGLEMEMWDREVN